MQKKLLSCLLALMLFAAPAFSAGAVCAQRYAADVVMPDFDPNSLYGTTAVYTQNAAENTTYTTGYTAENTTYTTGYTAENTTYTAEYTAEDMTEYAAEDAPRSAAADETASAQQEDATIILYGIADVPDVTQPYARTEPAKGSVVKSVVICAVIGLVIALIAVLGVKSSYKPVHRRRDAAEYLVDGSLRVTGSTDTFVRSERSERTIENKNPSGSDT